MYFHTILCLFSVSLKCTGRRGQRGQRGRREWRGRRDRLDWRG